MPNCLLFIDMLGVKARWIENGRDGAEAAFKRLGDLAAVAATSIKPEVLISAFAESDAFCAEVSNVDDALRIAERIYRAAFEKDYERSETRTWLRGVIVRGDGKELRSSISPLVNLPTFHRNSYSGPLLDAINVEKSGFRGMRLLVASDLIDDSLRKRHMVTSDGLKLAKITRLQSSYYPKRTESFEDYLWFAPASKKQWSNYETIMATRLRLSAKLQDEFVQAAATQVVFHEVRAIFSSLAYKYGPPKQKG